MAKIFHDPHKNFPAPPPTYFMNGPLYLFWKLPEFLEMQIRFIRTMLVRILSLKNDSFIFFSPQRFLHFDFLSGDGGATTRTKFMCNLSSLFYR